MKVGDLVVVVKPSPCCGKTAAVGRVFVIANFYQGLVTCYSCNQLFSGELARAVGDFGGITRRRSMRTPPFPELIDELIADEVTV